MSALLRTDDFSSGSFESLLSGSSSMLNFEHVSFLRPWEAAELDEEGLRHSEKKRRLTASQVQSLEKSFEAENKLEPDRKARLARDLGLQPRQVAIWFQNRRARWRTKQLERDYEALKSSYDALKADYESLLVEKHELGAEVARLTDELLVKEKGSGVAGTPPEANKAHCSSKCEEPEIRSSADSAVSDSEGSSNAFELHHSDISHAVVDEEERAGARGYEDLLKLEDMPCSFEFAVVEEHPFWLWS